MLPAAVILGHHEVLPAPSHGKALAKRLHARLTMLEGAHPLHCAKCIGQTNLLLASLVLRQRHSTAVRNWQ